MCSQRLEGYLRYVFLLGEGAPLVLRSFVRREQSRTGRSLEHLTPNDDLRVQLVGKDPDKWTISDFVAALLRLYGKSVARQERLEINYISCCRTELSSMPPKSLTDDDVTRLTSDLVMSLLCLSVQTDQKTYDEYQTILAEVRELSGQQILQRLEQGTEFEASLVETLHKFVTSEQTTAIQTLATDEDTDDSKALRTLKELLTKALLYGINLSCNIVFDEFLEIKGPDNESETKATLLLLKVFSEVIRGATEGLARDGIVLGTVILHKAVRSLVDIIQAQDAVRVREVLYQRGLTLRFKVQSVMQLRRLLKTVESSEFMSALGGVAALMAQEFGVSITLRKKALEAGLDRVKENLASQGVAWGSYKDLACTCGEDQPIVSFCDNHDVLCCHLCSVKYHSSCPGLNKTTENEAENPKVVDDKEYFVKMEEDLDVCSINGCCILPNDDVMLTDGNNRCLKRLTKLGILSRVDLPRVPLDVCCIGPNKAAVGLKENGIQLVANNNTLELLNVLATDHPVFGLVSDGHVIYATDGTSCVYLYRMDGTEKKVLYRSESRDVSFSKVALGAEGTKLYIEDGCGGLETIDTQGNHLYTLRNEQLRISRGIALAADGTVLVCEYDNNTVLRIDAGGKKVLGVILSSESGIQQPCTLGYDRDLSKLVVGMRERGSLSVFHMK